MPASARQYVFRSGGVNHRFDFRDGIHGKLTTTGVLTNDFSVGGDIDAIDLVVRNITLHPLNLRPQRLHNTTGRLRNYSELLRGQLARSRNLTLNHVSWHWTAS